MEYFVKITLFALIVAGLAWAVLWLMGAPVPYWRTVLVCATIYWLIEVAIFVSKGENKH